MPRVSPGAPVRLPQLVLCVVVLALAACGGGGSVAPSAPFVVSVPGTLPPPTQPLPTPPPAPPSAPIWDEVAVDLERVALFGSFPSDLARFEQSLFVVDADQIEADGAWVRAFDVGAAGPVPSTRFADTRIGVEHLVDSDGAAADLGAPIGFGFYVGDIVLADATLAFALVNAGGSDGAPALSNLIVFNPSAGQVLQTVNLAWTFRSASPLIDSLGNAAAGNAILQSGAEALAYVQTTWGPRLYVALTNLLVNPPSYGAVKQRGTLQVYDVFAGLPEPVRARPRGTLPTQTLLTQGYNPVALHALEVPGTQAAPALTRLLVTVGGTTAYDASYRLLPVTDASVEVYEAGNASFEGRFVLGLAGLAGTRPAVGRDAAGHLLGFYPSSVTGEIYVLRLDGLADVTVDVGLLAVLRGPGQGLPVSVADAGGPGANIGGCALAPDGRSLVVTSFGDLFAFPAALPGTLRVLALPEDVVTGAAFGPLFVPGTNVYASASGRTMGRLLLWPNTAGRPDVFVLVGGSIDTGSYLGSGPGSLGTLTTFGLIR